MEQLLNASVMNVSQQHLYQTVHCTRKAACKDLRTTIPMDGTIKTVQCWESDSSDGLAVAPHANPC